MRPDEVALLKAIQQRTSDVWSPEYQSVRSIVEGLGMNTKRADYILDKWDDKGWYEYGVCVDMGWLTDEGKAVVV